MPPTPLVPGRTTAARRSPSGSCDTRAARSRCPTLWRSPLAGRRGGRRRAAIAPAPATVVTARSRARPLRPPAADRTDRACLPARRRRRRPRLRAPPRALASRLPDDLVNPARRSALALPSIACASHWRPFLAGVATRPSFLFALERRHASLLSRPPIHTVWSYLPGLTRDAQPLSAREGPAWSTRQASRAG